MHRDAAEAFLGRSWSVVERDAAAYISAAEALVVRWEWVARTDTLWEVPEPRVGFEDPIRVLTEEPEPERRANTRRFGYDADGRIVVARYFQDHWEGRDGGTQYGVLFIEAVVAGPVLLRFHHERWGPTQRRITLGSLVQSERDEQGRVCVVRWWWGLDRFRESRYRFEGDRVTEKHREEFEYDNDEGFRSRERLRYDYEHDEQGLLRMRWTDEFSRYFPESEGDSAVSWFRRSPGAVRAARKLVNDRLPALIEAWVARVAPAEPVYGLGLVHSLDAPGLPPALGLGTLAELQAWQARCPDVDELRAYAFNPAEFRCYDPIPDELVSDPALQDAYAVLNQDWELAETDREPAATLRRCAKRLLTTDWSRLLTPARDFVVFVVADEQDDHLVKHLRATIPADTIKRLTRPGDPPR